MVVNNSLLLLRKNSTYRAQLLKSLNFVNLLFLAKLLKKNTF
jgi:hypothetical protein